jgi:hypothetical protein
MDQTHEKPEPIKIGPSKPIRIGPSKPIIITPGPPPITIGPSGPPFRRIQPLYILEEEGLTQGEQIAITQGVMECLRLAGVTNRLRVVGLGVWRPIGCRDSRGSLIPRGSIDALLAASPDRKRSEGIICANTLLGEASHTPRHATESHYFLMAIRRDMGGNMYPLMGNTTPQTGAVVSTYRLRNGYERLRPTDIEQCLMTIIMHEVGHIFGLWPAGSGERCYLHHCPPQNRCVMRAMFRLDTDALIATRDRVSFGKPFCDGCLANLRQYFTGH